jgi:hypothetical protein
MISKSSRETQYVSSDRMPRHNGVLHVRDSERTTGRASLVCLVFGRPGVIMCAAPTDQRDRFAWPLCRREGALFVSAFLSLSAQHLPGSTNHVPETGGRARQRAHHPISCPPLEPSPTRSYPWRHNSRDLRSPTAPHARAHLQRPPAYPLRPHSARTQRSRPTCRRGPQARAFTFKPTHPPTQTPRTPTRRPRAIRNRRHPLPPQPLASRGARNTSPTQRGASPPPRAARSREIPASRAIST